MTILTLAAVFAVAVGGWWAYRYHQERQRPRVGHVRIQRRHPLTPPPARTLAIEAPLVAPDLHLPEIRGRYAKLGLLDAEPVERDTAAALAQEAADFAAIVDGLRDPDFEAALDVTAMLDRFDAEAAELTGSFNQAHYRLAVRHEQAQQRVDLYGWQWYSQLPSGERLALTGGAV